MVYTMDMGPDDTRPSEPTGAVDPPDPTVPDLPVRPLVGDQPATPTEGPGSQPGRGESPLPLPSSPSSQFGLGLGPIPQTNQSGLRSAPPAGSSPASPVGPLPSTASSSHFAGSPSSTPPTSGVAGGSVGGPPTSPHPTAGPPPSFPGSISAPSVPSPERTDRLSAGSPPPASIAAAPPPAGPPTFAAGAPPADVMGSGSRETSDSGRMRRSTAIAWALGAFVLGGAVGIGGYAAGRGDSAGRSAQPSIANAVNSTSATSAGQSTVERTIVTETGVEPAAAVAAVVGPSVVQVETPSGQGSGVVYADGLVLTNHHVIADSGGRIRIRSSSGEVFEVELVGSDARNDIAVLSASGAALPVAALGAMEDVEVGQLAVAIGSPFALQQTVTSGIISSLNRPVPNMANSYSAMIQTDASINPGNSGGALANRNGEIVGINASIRTDGFSNTNVGIGFAIPINSALAVADRIVNGESLEPAVLGIQRDLATSDDAVGVPFDAVTPGSAADKAGLQPGDRIVTFDGAPVTNFEELIGLVQSRFPGDTVDLVIERNGDDQVIQATLD